MNSFVSAETEEWTQGRDHGRPGRGDLNDGTGAVAGRTRLLGKEKRIGEGIIGRAIDGTEAGLARRVHWSQQRDAVRRIGDIEIDPCDIGEVSAILVALIEEIATIIEARGRTTGILRKAQIEIL